MFILQNDIYIAVGFELGIEEERQSLRVPALAATGLDFDRRADAVSASAAPAPTFSLTSHVHGKAGHRTLCSFTTRYGRRCPRMMTVS